MFEWCRRQHGLEIHPQVIDDFRNETFGLLDVVLEVSEGYPLPKGTLEQSQIKLNLYNEAIVLLGKRIKGEELSSAERSVVKTAIKSLRDQRLA